MTWHEWIRTVEVEPSLYAADFSVLGEQVETLLRAGARILHYDVGDGHFVEPITMGPIVLASIAPLVLRLGGVVDCHLMVEQPERHFRAFREAGADSVTVHYETCDDLAAVAHAARQNGLCLGLAFNPDTPVENAAGAAAAAGCDIVTCMGVFPGYSGQEFIPETRERVRLLRRLLAPEIAIQVDGGVGQENIRSLKDAGAALFVAASAIFGQEDLPRAYGRLVQALA